MTVEDMEANEEVEGEDMKVIEENHEDEDWNT